jgi:hypothetical protein
MHPWEFKWKRFLAKWATSVDCELQAFNTQTVLLLCRAFEDAEFSLGLFPKFSFGRFGGSRSEISTRTSYRFALLLVRGIPGTTFG